MSDTSIYGLTSLMPGVIFNRNMPPGKYPTFSTIVGMIIIVGSLTVYFKGAGVG